MERQPLPRTLRLRIIVVAVSSTLLVLLFIPFEVLAVTKPRGGTEEVVTAFAVGVGLPILFALLMWRQVRRYRRDPGVRRRQPNGPAARTILFGNLVSILVAMTTNGLVGGWQGWLVGLAVLLACSFIVLRIAKRQDPRIHYFRRPDPLPPGQEPDDARPPAPW